jgi:hypothetical protein
VSKQRWLCVAPTVISLTLVLAACGGGGNSAVAQQPAAPAAPAAPADAGQAASVPAAPEAKGAASTTGTSTGVVGPAKPAPALAPAAKAAPKAAPKAVTKGHKAAGTKGAVAGADGVSSIDSASEAAENEKIAAAKDGATDIGVTKNEIKFGTISMHGMALGNVLVTPLVNGIRASMSAINDRGGILGRHMSLIDCDDGPGEVSRTKGCIKKLVGQDKIFSLMSISSWGSGSVHDDLKQYQVPAFGMWAYSQTEWQDPFMFPTHMSMIHEAMAGANWVKNVIKPQTYGLICLTSPEMQLACNQVQKVLDATGAKMVKRADVSISETSMSAYVLAMRAANPDHIVHYVINPATMAKFMVEAAQQGYYPPKGISGNHLAAEVLGSLFGKWPVNRYWTNTTYKLWGPEFIATMNKYARTNAGTNHHIVQASYVGVNIFAAAAKAVGPNLTRARMMAQWDNGTVYESDASLDQRFAYTPSERTSDNWDHNYGQGREFIYKYTASNTTANPDGSPNGFVPDPDQFVIYTWK